MGPRLSKIGQKFVYLQNLRKRVNLLFNPGGCRQNQLALAAIRDQRIENRKIDYKSFKILVINLIPKSYVWWLSYVKYEI